MKARKIITLCLSIIILLQVMVFSVLAVDNGTVYIFTYTWSDLNTRAAGSPTVLRHLWNMGYDAGEYLNNGAPAAYSVYPYSQIFVISSHGNAGRVKLGSENNVSRIFANCSVSGNNRSLSNLGSNSLANLRLVMYSTCYSGKTSNTEGNLVTMTRSKGAQCVVGWNDTLFSGSSDEWIRLFFEKADEAHKPVWECFNHADYWIRDIYGSNHANLLVDRHEQGDIYQYLHQ